MSLNKFKHNVLLAIGEFFIKLMPKSSYMTFIGADSSRQLCGHICRSGATSVLVVTDKILVELGIIENALETLRQHNVEYSVFSEVTPDPTFALVAKGTTLAKAQRCDAVLAIGGGSSIDTAKIIAAAAVNSGTPVDWVGFAKLKKAALPLYAIPTTSGTGSEATRGAVISNDVTHVKSVIADSSLLPSAVALDSLVLVGMPKAITAATGIDALTHAIEAYIGNWKFGDSKQYSINATRLIFQHLKTACEDGSNAEAREAMALAAYYAGIAINEVNVGNVHAIAHQLGGKYGIPHGVANGLALPHVLELSRPAADPQLATLARAIGASQNKQSDTELADYFIQQVIKLRADIGLPEQSDKLLKEDFPALTKLVLKEAFEYPTPVFFQQQQVLNVLEKMLAK